MSKRIWYKPLKTVLAAGLVANLLIPAIPLTTEAATKAAEDLIISEYIEGSSYNKAIELYNGTGSDVDLSHVFTFERHSNGADTASSKILCQVHWKVEIRTFYIIKMPIQDIQSK